MKSRLLLSGLLSLGLAASASATLTNFSDNFDNSPPGQWTTWPSAVSQVNADSSHNFTTGGTTSVKASDQYKQYEGDYHDLGATAGSVDATVYVEDDNNHVGSSSFPVNVAFGLYGDAGASLPNVDTDHQLLEVSNVGTTYNDFFINSGSGTGTDSYLHKPADNNNFVDTGVTRTQAKAGGTLGQDGALWDKLEIQADALTSDGGDGVVRYYINNVLVGTSMRQPGVDLRYVYVGNHDDNNGWVGTSYQYWYFDNVSVTPEPASLSLLALGAGGLLVRRRRTA